MTWVDVPEALQRNPKLPVRACALEIVGAPVVKVSSPPPLVLGVSPSNPGHSNPVR
jgi:hypothetical protein